jgi:hypothetical protein
MGETIKSLVGEDNSVALAIAGMGPDQRRSYIRGLYANGREFTRDEYAAIKAAEAMDSLPGQWQSYGSTGRRGTDRQVPDSVVKAYRDALNDGVTKVPVAGVDDWVYITERPTQGVAAAPGGSVLAGVLSQGAPAAARVTSMPAGMSAGKKSFRTHAVELPASYRSSGEGNFYSGPGDYLGGQGDFDAENVYSVLGHWPETDGEWAYVEEQMGYPTGNPAGTKFGMQRKSYRPGEVLGERGMQRTPNMNKR